MKKVAILILFMLGCAISEGYAQKVALKSNLLYDATTTMNLGLEIGLVRKWTLDIPVNYNPWKLSDGKRLRHWGIQPEVRYWFCESFRRMFVGMHGHYADFNVGGMKFLGMSDRRYQGGPVWGGCGIRVQMAPRKKLERRGYGSFGLSSFGLRPLRLEEMRTSPRSGA